MNATLAPELVPSSIPWLDIALQEFGVTEEKGGENPRILEYHRVAGTGQDEDEDAWCGAFMGWVMVQAGLPKPKGAGAARSWLGWGVPTKPRYGCVVVFRRGPPGGWQGHVGILVASRSGRWFILGGNQSDSVRITPYDPSDVLGCRWPA
jgi:uncharacterized protein (TIGR02594 family)